MKAIILSAGRGERLKPLTNFHPKPLIEVRGRPLIVWHIMNLVNSGITEIIINHSYLGNMIEDLIGNGNKFGANIIYSAEKKALETGGGIIKAKGFLNKEPFVAIAADIFCPSFNFNEVKNVLQEKDIWGKKIAKNKKDLAWLYMVKNPEHNPLGDFALKSYSISYEGSPRLTFSGIGVYRPEIFENTKSGTIIKLSEILKTFIKSGRVGGEIFHGLWKDIGTIERLNEINKK
tara:strand:+ start:1292 stop:1990 length:699 start_codon:yes stop_codon:yes gene_type:complete